MLIYLQAIDTEEERDLFLYVYESHSKQMAWVANRILQNKEDTEDAVHDAFVGIANNISSLRTRSKTDIRNYALKAAQNAALDICRKKKPIQAYNESIVEFSNIDLLFEQTCLREAFDTVVAAIKSLGEPYGFVLYCVYVMEMNINEIASQLSRKPDTVRKQILRGKKQLLMALRKEVDHDNA